MPLLVDDARVDGRPLRVSRHGDGGFRCGPRRAEQRRGDVRDPEQPRRGVPRCRRVVVHLAYDITGTTNPGSVHTVNAEGATHCTRRGRPRRPPVRAYASSLAAYGFSDRNPDRRGREAARLGVDDPFFYARDKARGEQLLAEESAHHPEVEVHVVRPSGVVGPDLRGRQSFLFQARSPPSAARTVAAATTYARLGLPLAVPAFPAAARPPRRRRRGACFSCALGPDPPGPCNVAGDGVVTLAQLARGLGAGVLELPAEVAEVPSRAAMTLPLPLRCFLSRRRPTRRSWTPPAPRSSWGPGFGFTGLGAWRDAVR